MKLIIKQNRKGHTVHKLYKQLWNRNDVETSRIFCDSVTQASSFEYQGVFLPV